MERSDWPTDENKLHDLNNQNNNQPTQPDSPVRENEHPADENAAGGDEDEDEEPDQSEEDDNTPLNEGNAEDSDANVGPDNDQNKIVADENIPADDNAGTAADDDDNDSTGDDNDNDTDVNPAVSRALKKLASDGELPKVLGGRTRKQARDAVANVVTANNLIDHLASRRIARVTCPADHNPVLADLEAIAMTHLNLKQGLKAFGEAGVEAVQTELKQLHDLKVVKPVHGNQLSKEQRAASLRHLMYLKQKRCGRIKGRGCADGRKQRIGTKKEDASSPTVAIESMMISCTIDAKEGHDVATCDIRGASCRQTWTRLYMSS